VQRISRPFDSNGVRHDRDDGNVMTKVMLANIVVHDRAHLGFRAIHKMGNISFLSGVIWGNAWVIRWRHCWQVGTTSADDTLRRLVEVDNHPAFHRKRSPFDV